MKVEVIRATPGNADSVTVSLAAGATLRDALAAAGYQLDPQEKVGIFGRRASLDQPLAEGDRVEIYRPLAVDPKEARRRRAARKKR